LISANSFACSGVINSWQMWWICSGVKRWSLIGITVPLILI
jgi:hypothetical protein